MCTHKRLFFGIWLGKNIIDLKPMTPNDGQLTPGESRKKKKSNIVKTTFGTSDLSVPQALVCDDNSIH